MMKSRSLLLAALAPVTIAVAVLAVDLPLKTLTAAPGAGPLYGTSGTFAKLLNIHPATGSATVIGNLLNGRVSPAFPSIALDPTTGIMYIGEARGFAALWRVNPATAVNTLIGDAGLGFAAVAGLDFRDDGTLFAAVNIAGGGRTGADHLATMDLDTGLATIVGPFGSCTGVTLPSTGGGECTIEGIEGIAFDGAGTLWGSHSTRGAGGPHGLYQIDPATGAATFIRPIIDPQGNPPSGGVVSLQFDCDDNLFGGSARAESGFEDGGKLVHIDSHTGLYQFAGSGNTTPDERSLGGLAFGEPCVDDPRSQGFWTHQCSELGFHQVDPESMDGYFTSITDSSPAFDACGVAACETLTGKGSKMIDKATRQLLALRLNVASGRLPLGIPIELGSLSGAMTIAQALDEVETAVCDPGSGNADLEQAKNIAEALNLGGIDAELATLDELATVEPGNSHSFLMAVINMSPYTWSYDLTALASYNVSFTRDEIRNLKSGEMALVGATVAVPPTAQNGELIQVDLELTDQSVESTLTRQNRVSVMVTQTSGGGSGDTPLLNERDQN